MGSRSKAVWSGLGEPSPSAAANVAKVADYLDRELANAPAAECHSMRRVTEVVRHPGPRSGSWG
jgi:hypothetical protein